MRIIDADKMIADLLTVDPQFEPMIKWCITVIEAQPTVNEWIPCSESLPEYGIGVLTFNRDGEYEVNHVIDEEYGEWFWGGVIAWMPLPEPYKEADT